MMKQTKRIIGSVPESMLNTQSHIQSHARRINSFIRLICGMWHCRWRSWIGVRFRFDCMWITRFFWNVKMWQLTGLNLMIRTAWFVFLLYLFHSCPFQSYFIAHRWDIRAHFWNWNVNTPCGPFESKHDRYVHTHTH